MIGPPEGAPAVDWAKQALAKQAFQDAVEGPKARKRKAPKSLGGLRWTNRFKRWGGLKGVEERRFLDAGILAAAVNNNNFSKARRQIAKDLLEWLLENPLRVLPVAARDYLTPLPETT